MYFHEIAGELKTLMEPAGRGGKFVCTLVGLLLRLPMTDEEGQAQYLHEYNPKSEDQGKGYRSLLNSVVALMLYEYFNSDDVFIKPGFLMVDMPLLGFDENEDEFGDNTIKNGLYQYFINHQGDGQVIIIDNQP